MNTNQLLAGVAVGALMMFSAVQAQANGDGPAPPLEVDWSGLFVGVHVGGASLSTDGVFNEGSSSGLDLGALSDSGFMGGGQIGWNFQNHGNWVFGIVGDISGAGIDGTAISADEPDSGPGSLDTDFLATIRGRVGWATGNALLYLTGGVAFYEGEFAIGGNCTGSSCKKDISATGGVVGAGAEVAVSERLSLFAESLFAFFNDKTSMEGVGGGSQTGRSGEFLEIKDVVIGRVGLNVRFNPGG